MIPVDVAQLSHCAAIASDQCPEQRPICVMERSVRPCQEATDLGRPDHPRPQDSGGRKQADIVWQKPATCFEQGRSTGKLVGLSLDAAPWRGRLYELAGPAWADFDMSQRHDRIGGTRKRIAQAQQDPCIRQESIAAGSRGPKAKRIVDAGAGGVVGA